MDTPNLRKHLGNDLLAAMGTPLLAVDNGTIRFGTDPRGGNVANLYAEDGTRYYYAHLSNFEGTSGRQVRAGEVIGYIGMTGNAEGTVPHTHFEVHPVGGGASPGTTAINPFPELQTALARRAMAASSAPRWLAPLAVIGATAFGAWALFNYVSPTPQRSVRRTG